MPDGVAGGHVQKVRPPAAARSQADGCFRPRVPAEPEPALSCRVEAPADADGTEAPHAAGQHVARAATTVARFIRLPRVRPAR